MAEGPCTVAIDSPTYSMTVYMHDQERIIINECHYATRSSVTFDLTLTPSAPASNKADLHLSNLTETCLKRVIGEQLAYRAANREEGTCVLV